MRTFALDADDHQERATPTLEDEATSPTGQDCAKG